MKNIKKVISKGYTVEVTSWENDGDNYRTQSATFDSLEEAGIVTKMCRTLFKSSNNGEGGIGNLMDDEDDEAISIILKYVDNNPEVKSLKKDKSQKISEVIMNINYTLMGGSEYYYSRVCEKVTVLYSSADVSIEEIKI